MPYSTEIDCRSTVYIFCTSQIAFLLCLELYHCGLWYGVHFLLVTYCSVCTCLPHSHSHSLSIKFWLVMHYLANLTEDQTLVMHSGHPVGLFPSSPAAPRMVISNGMVSVSHSVRNSMDPLCQLYICMYVRR